MPTIDVLQGPKYVLGVHLEGEKLKQNGGSTINEVAPIKDIFAEREMTS